MSQTWQTRDKSAKGRIRTNANERLDNVLTLVDDRLGSVLEVLLSTNLITVGPAIRQELESNGAEGTQNSYKQRLPVVGGIDYNPVLQSTLDLTNGTTTGSFANVTDPGKSISANAYVQMGIALRSDKKLYIVWGEENAVLENTTPPAFGDEDIQCLVLKLKNNGTVGAWKFNTPSKSDVEKVLLGGSAGGGGTGSDQLASMRDRLQASDLSLLNAILFDSDKDKRFSTFTGSLDYSNKGYKLDNGQLFLSENLLGESFYNAFSDIDAAKLEVVLLSELNSVLAEVTRNGVDYSTVTLTREKNSGSYVGDLTFSEEATDRLTQAISNTQQELSATAISIPVTIANNCVIKSLTLPLVNVGSPTGSVRVSIWDVSNNLLWMSNYSLISSYSSPLAVKVPVKAGQITIKVEGDSVYQSSYVASTTAVKVNENTVSLSGRELFLKVRVTSQVNGLLVKGFGCSYVKEIPMTVLSDLEIQRFEFSGDLDQQTFQVTNFVVNPNTLEVNDVYAGKVYKWPAFSVDVSGNVSFSSGVFARPNETVHLVFSQAKNSGVDTSDVNATNIANIQDSVNNLDNQDRVLLSEIAAIGTSIIGRTPIKTAVGLVPLVETFYTRDIVRLLGEQGPNGESVWGVLGDVFNRFRHIGGGAASRNDNNGQGIKLDYQNDCHEFTFYINTNGGSLNWLVMGDSSAAQDFRVTLDGGAEGTTNVKIVSTAIFQSRQYAPYHSMRVASNLTKGWHTIKIRRNDTSYAGSYGITYGFEIVNTQLSIYPGQIMLGKKKITVEEQFIAYKAGMTSVRGGRVLVSIDKNGVVALNTNTVNTTPGYLTSTDHSNEEMGMPIYPRMFGANRADDFSLLSTSGSLRYAQLEDNHQSLETTSAYYYTEANSSYTDVETLGIGVVGFTKLTLPQGCCGLDMVLTRKDGVSGTCPISINGTSIGTLPLPNTKIVTSKVASGLAIGTNIVRFAPVTTDMMVQYFIPYFVKKPSLPTGNLEIADYTVNADFVANTVSTVDSVAIGTVRKHCLRNFVYSGATFTINSIDPAQYIGSTEVLQSASGSGGKLTVPIIGHSFEWRQLSNTTPGTFRFKLNGLDLTVANFPTAVFSTYGGTGYSFNSATGDLTASGVAVPAAGFRVSGLPLACYLLEVTNTNASGQLRFSALDVGLPVVAVNDNRNYLSSPRVGIIAENNIQTGVAWTTTSTSFVHIKGLPTYCKKGWYEISFTGAGYVTTGNGTIALSVNGQLVKKVYITSASSQAIPVVKKMYLNDGYYFFAALAKTSNSTFYIEGANSAQELTITRLGD